MLVTDLLLAKYIPYLPEANSTTTLVYSCLINLEFSASCGSESEPYNFIGIYDRVLSD